MVLAQDQSQVVREHGLHGIVPCKSSGIDRKSHQVGACSGMASMVVAFFGAGCFFVVVASVSFSLRVVAIVRRAPLAATPVRPFRLHPRSSMKPAIGVVRALAWFSSPMWPQWIGCPHVRAGKPCNWLQIASTSSLPSPCDQM